MRTRTKGFGLWLVATAFLTAGQALAQPPGPAPLDRLPAPVGGPPAGPPVLFPAGQDTPAPAAPAAGPCPAAPEEAEQPGAFLLRADYLLLEPRRQPFDFAIVGPTGPFGPQGDVQSLTWDVSSGFRAGGGYRLPGGGWEVGFYYTYLQANASASAVAPDGGQLFPTLTHPGGVELASSAAADAQLSYNVFDVEFGKAFEAGKGLAVRVFAGPRFAVIDQNVEALYDGGDANRDRVASRIDFDGGGVRLGAEAQQQVYRGLGLYARGGASLLAGSFRTSLTETTNDGSAVIVNVTDRFTKVVPVLELGMGLSWQYHSWRVTAGYEFVNWFGLVEGIDFADDSHRGKPLRRTGDLSLDGLVLRAEYTY